MTPGGTQREGRRELQAAAWLHCSVAIALTVLSYRSRKTTSAD